MPAAIFPGPGPWLFQDVGHLSLKKGMGGEDPHYFFFCFTNDSELFWKCFLQKFSPEFKWESQSGKTSDELKSV